MTLVVAGVLALPAVGRAAVLQQFRIPATTTAVPLAAGIDAHPRPRTIRFTVLR